MAKEIFGNLNKPADKPADAPKTEQVAGVTAGTKDPLDHDADGKKGGTAPAAAPAKDAPAKTETTEQTNAGQSKPAAKEAEKAVEGEKTSEQTTATELGAPALGSPTPAPLTPVAPMQGEQAAEINKPDVTEGNATTAPTTTEPNLLDPDEDEDDDEVIQKPDELTFLKQKADFMGIKYPNNIQLAALKAKIAEKLSGEPLDTDAEQEKLEAKEENVTGENPETATLSPFAGGNSPKGKKLSLRKYLQQEKMKLVRLRITNMDPKKKDLPGEIFTVANEFLGTVRKFIPFGEQTDNGFHVPYCLFEQLRDRRFLNVRTRKGPHGTPVVESTYVKEFALEVLPPLTTEELARLSASQAAAGGLDN